MSDSTITCPHCKKTIPLSQALSHQLEEQFQARLDTEIQKREEREKKLIENAKKRIEEERQKVTKEMKEKQKQILQEEETKLKQKIQKEMELTLKDKINEAEELRTQNKQFQEQVLEMSKTLRKMQAQGEQARLELEKKLAEEQDKIRIQEQKRMDEEYRLRIAEYDKKLTDAAKANMDLKRKLEQGSQQMQGEVQELVLEQILRQEFSYDKIEEVPKGIRGADAIQLVRNRFAKDCGRIIWESKRTKAWSESWIAKLKEDQRQVHADIAILISQALPEDIKHFGEREGIWICDYDAILPLAHALRAQLIQVAAVQASSINKKEKMEVLYAYLSGTEFRQRVEAIVEAFDDMQKNLETEKRWFAKKWAKEEKNIRRVMDNTAGMHGDLQSIMGRALGEIQGLEALGEDNEEEEKEEQRLL